MITSLSRSPLMLRPETSNELVALNDVVKVYTGAAGKFTALKGVNLTVMGGEFVAIIGKSGSGKSTLINMMTGIDHPTRGEIFIAGAALHTMTEEQIAIWRGRAIGVIFQFFQLLPTLTAVENVMLSMDYGRLYPSAERPERAMALLEKMEMVGNAHRFPRELSGGQQQSIAIARALANDPPLIMADEPTGNLDSQSTRRVFGLFEKLVDEGKTVLMVTHDSDLARQTRRIVQLADGEIVSDRPNRARLKPIAALPQEEIQCLN